MSEIDELRKQKDGAYSERNQLVCALTKAFPYNCWMERHPDSDTEWEDDWRWIVFIDSSEGSMSWHIHDSELGWFDHLPRRDGNSWDGHSVEEKYRRLRDGLRVRDRVAS